MCVDGKPVRIENIISKRDQSETFIVFRRFLQCENFFDYPLPSSDLGIYSVCRLSGRLEKICITDVTTKCMLLPYRDTFLAIPLL